MKIAITGASGLIGRRLMQALSGHSLLVFSRRADVRLPAGVSLAVWDPMAGPPGTEVLAGTDVVIHLAGEPVAQRWTAEVKRRILESRTIGTRNLVQGLSRMQQAPAALISSSAVGYYGSRGDEILSEASAPGQGFLSEVCLEWEREADAAMALGTRVAKVRTGVVLEPKGGALARMLTPFRLGIAGRLGSGRQWMSWIHIDDLVQLMVHATKNPIRGAVNGVAPNPVTNAVFTRTLAGVLHRPAILPVPALGLSLLFGEMAEVLLNSQRAVPFAAEQAGFRFQWPELKPALQNLLEKSS